jgi:hypothetical protein
MDIADILKKGEHLFSAKLPLLSLWQDIGDQFYPERADFTTMHSIGDEFADHLSSSYPLIARRELGDAMSSMLRPTSKEWFKVTTEQPEQLSHGAKQWLEWAAGVQKRAMYDRQAQFHRATKTADHDYVTFGQAVMSLEINRKAQTLLYRTWHLRDVAWCEGEDGQVDEVHHNWKRPLRQLAARFPGKLSARFTEKIVRDEPYREVQCRRVVMRSEYFTGKKFKAPWVVLDIDVENNHLMEVSGSNRMLYIVPRWHMNGLSQYAYSPAMMIAIPEARLLQAMTLTLLEAGEKAVDPPMVARGGVIRDDVNLFAGGITNIDMDYDERMGSPLYPVIGDMKNIPLSLEMLVRSQNTLAECLYLSKLALPIFDRNTTATEIVKRTQEQIRQVAPLFEPMESEYNAPLCEDTFSLLMQEGTFGPKDDIPAELWEQQVVFKFESPLHEAVEKMKGQTLLETAGMVAQIAAVDQSATAIMDWKKALRDAIAGNGAPAAWMRSEEDVQADADEMKEKMAMAQTLAAMDQGAGVAEKAGKAAVSLGDAGVI